MSTADPGRVVSRRVVIVAAVGGAAVGVGACGGGTPEAAPSPGPTAEPTSRPAAAPTTHTRPVRPLAAPDEIPVGGGRVFPDERVVVTQPTPGEFRGFGIVCTHDGCELDGVAKGTINCPCHGSRYAITDGSVVRGPARTGLRREQVALRDGRIVLL